MRGAWDIGTAITIILLLNGSLCQAQSSYTFLGAVGTLQGINKFSSLLLSHSIPPGSSSQYFQGVVLAPSNDVLSAYEADGGELTTDLLRYHVLPMATLPSTTTSTVATTLYPQASITLVSQAAATNISYWAFGTAGSMGHVVYDQRVEGGSTSGCIRFNGVAWVCRIDSVLQPPGDPLLSNVYAFTQVYSRIPSPFDQKASNILQTTRDLIRADPVLRDYFGNSDRVYTYFAPNNDAWNKYFKDTKTNFVDFQGTDKARALMLSLAVTTNSYPYPISRKSPGWVPDAQYVFLQKQGDTILVQSIKDAAGKYRNQVGQLILQDQLLDSAKCVVHVVDRVLQPLEISAGQAESAAVVATAHHGVYILLSALALLLSWHLM